jgi:hypothetical protein
MVGVAATVLYEDQLGPNRAFGLHTLVEACVFDIVNGQRYQLTNCLEARPMKGDGNLLKSARNDVEKIAADGRRVFAVFDNDKIRIRLGLSKAASDMEVETAIRQGARCDASLLAVILLKENTESVLAAARDCHGALDQELLHDAIDQKDLNARDIVLKRVAASATSKQIRDCVLSRVPSVGVLVSQLVGICRSSLFAMRTLS